MTDVVLCMDALDYLKGLPADFADLILTDPPYGIGVEKGRGRINQDFSGSWDSKTPDKEVFDELLRVGKTIIIFGGNFFTDKLPVSSRWLVWDKIGQLKNHGTNHSDCELLWTNLERGPIKKYYHQHRGVFVDGEHKYHPTQKPLRLLLRLINDFSSEGDLILDPFVGSGSTALAAKLSNRQYAVCDISEAYIEITKKRLYQKSLVGVEDLLMLQDSGGGA